MKAIKVVFLILLGLASPWLFNHINAWVGIIAALLSISLIIHHIYKQLNTKS